MAGYFIYSLDWDKFQNFVNKPTSKQLLEFAEIISDGLDGADDVFEEDDPVHDWPSEPEELRDLVKERLARPDWYGDLSAGGKSIWSEAVWGFCCHKCSKEVGFRADHDGIYWDLIELARKHFNAPSEEVLPDVALSAFGLRPYRCPNYAPDPDAYEPQFMHSMHAPDEVRKMLEELKAIGPAIEKSRNNQAIGDYDGLLPVLEALDKENRMLFIQVDT